MNKIYKTDPIQFIKSSGGYTIVELIVGLGVLSIATLIIVATDYQIKKDFKKVDDSLSGKVERLMGERVILFDLQSANPSFNNLISRDDNNNNFFDINLEVLLNSNSNPARQVTLSLKSKKTEIIFMVHDFSVGMSFVYDPVAAYSIGTAPNDFNKSASLIFKSLNKDNWISSQPGLEKIWVSNHILMLSSSSKVSENGFFPRSPIYIGYVNKNDLLPIPAEAGTTNKTHPADTKYIITSADKFLRTITSAGGGVPTVYITPVKFIKYFIEKKQNSQLDDEVQLFKSTYSIDKKWGNKLLLSDKVESVIFERTSLSLKMINFRIKTSTGSKRAL